MRRFRAVPNLSFLLSVFLIGSFMCAGTVLSCETATIESSDGAYVCLDQFPSVLEAECYLGKQNKTQAQFDWGTKDCREPRSIRQEIRDAKNAMALAVTLSPDSPQIAFSIDAYKTWKDFNDAYALDRCKELAWSNRIDVASHPCVLLGMQTGRRNVMKSTFSEQAIKDVLSRIEDHIKVARQREESQKNTATATNSLGDDLERVNVSVGLGNNGVCQSASIESSDGDMVCLDHFPMVLDRECRESGYASRAYANRRYAQGYWLSDCDETTFFEDINNVRKQIVLFAADTPKGIFYSFAVDGVWNTRPITEQLAEERCRQYLLDQYIDQTKYPCILIAKSTLSNPRLLSSGRLGADIQKLLVQLHKELVNPEIIVTRKIDGQVDEETLDRLAEKERTKLEREYQKALEESEQEKLRIAEEQRKLAEEERAKLEREYQMALEESEQEKQRITEEQRKLAEEERARLELEHEKVLKQIQQEKLRAVERERQLREELGDSNTYIDKRERVALLIGNSRYRTLPSLMNPSNDVQSMRRALKKANFKVSVYENLDLRGMQDTLRAFGELLDEETVGLFYFAGHGMQFEGKNYLVPVNENIVKPYELQTAALDLSLVTNTLKYASNDLNIVILDACRNNTLAASRGGDRGFAAVSAAEGIFIAFSTAPGQAALDGNGENSPYTKYLARAIESSSKISIETLFKQVRAQVMDETKKQQIPWENSSLLGEFRFR